MTEKIKQIDWQNVLSNNLISVIALVGTCAIMISQVSDLKSMAKEDRTVIQIMSERLTRVETKVQFMYDERKQEK